ncbi:MAG: AAA family ATPase [Rickettsiales bacterium]|jgi:cytidylate kinase|nr:AAA family ATPase [Rickettsiales bacterium]
MKTIIAINGRPGVGKDTICDVVRRHFTTVNVSSVTPIKKIALDYGWDGVKTDKSRKFLSDLKALFTEFNDMPTSYLVGEAEKFMDSFATVFFAHIREGAEIDKFLSRARAMVGDEARVRSLLVRRAEVARVVGNASDDEVENYRYDWIYDNDGSLASLDADFMEKFSKWQ